MSELDTVNAQSIYVSAVDADAVPSNGKITHDALQAWKF